MRLLKKLIIWTAVKFPDMILGSGSILDAPTAALYIQLGSNFIVSPVLIEDISLVVNRRKILWSPGCGSVSEISKAESLGVEIVKIFPGTQVGGPNFVASVKGSMPWTSIMPTGDVEPSETNLTEWFKAGVTCVGIGSHLISSEIIRTKDYVKLEQVACNAINIIQKLRKLYPVKI